VPAPCNVEHSNGKPGLECGCDVDDGWEGRITWQGPKASGCCFETYSDVHLLLEAQDAFFRNGEGRFKCCQMLGEKGEHIYQVHDMSLATKVLQDSDVDTTCKSNLGKEWEEAVGKCQVKWSTLSDALGTSRHDLIVALNKLKDDNHVEIEYASVSFKVDKLDPSKCLANEKVRTAIEQAIFSMFRGKGLTLAERVEALLSAGEHDSLIILAKLFPAAGTKVQTLLWPMAEKEYLFVMELGVAFEARPELQEVATGKVWVDMLSRPRIYQGSRPYKGATRCCCLSEKAETCVLFRAEDLTRSWKFATWNEPVCPRQHHYHWYKRFEKLRDQVPENCKGIASIVPAAFKSRKTIAK